MTSEGDTPGQIIIQKVAGRWAEVVFVKKGMSVRGALHGRFLVLAVRRFS